MKNMNMPRLQVLSAELLTLVQQGRYTRGEFERLWPQFQEAADGQYDVLGVVVNHTPDEWLEEALKRDRVPA